MSSRDDHRCRSLRWMIITDVEELSRTDRAKHFVIFDELVKTFCEIVDFTVLQFLQIDDSMNALFRKDLSGEVYGEVPEGVFHVRRY